MNTEAEQLFPVSSIPNRYGIGKQTALNRRNHLGITPIKQKGTNYITPEDLELMDRLHEFLQKPGTKMSDFPVPTESTTPTGHSGNGAMVNTSEIIESEQSQDLIALIDAIARHTKPEKQPLDHWEQLEKACNNGWLITTKEVHQLCGAKPKGKQWQRGSFIFTKTGKIGNQAAWLVEKL
jgi:hypothetical protein